VSTRRHPGWHRAIGGVAGLTRMAWHRCERKTGPAAAASTSVVTSSGWRRRLKAPVAPGSPGGGEGQDQLIRRGSEVALTKEGEEATVAAMNSVVAAMLRWPVTVVVVSCSEER
jgi:hypothetical protein